MLREPRQSEKSQQAEQLKNKGNGRFQIQKLEERIAPRRGCHTNPQGKTVGCPKK